MHISTARSTPVFRSSPPPPRQESEDSPILDAFCQAGNATMIALPGVVMGTGIGFGATMWPALALGGKAGAILAGGAALLGAGVGGYLSYSLARLD